MIVFGGTLAATLVAFPINEVMMECFSSNWGVVCFPRCRSGQKAS